MRKILVLIVSSIIICVNVIAEGSRTLAPNYPGTAFLVAPGLANNDFAWLEHDSGISGDFLDPSAGATERLFVHIKAGETLYWGLNRVDVRYQAGVAYASANLEHTAYEDLFVIIRENDGTLAQSTELTNTGGNAALTGPGGAGEISTVASSLLGPAFTFNSTNYNVGGYTPVSYTNNTGSDQDFYIEFLQDETGVTDINRRSWYDLWDFSVYNGNEEKPGRLHCQRWGITAQYFGNRLADEVSFYVQVPSTIGGVLSGNYIKEVDLGGLDPFSLIVYANSTGADAAQAGTTDFLELRRSQNNEIALIEYDLFLNNPDIDLYPTTTLPTVEISDAVFYCNAAATGGEGTIYFETNQLGFVSILVDLNGVSGYQSGTTDVIIEQEVTATGRQVVRWDGLDGLSTVVPSNTIITITGRFTAGPIHVPMWDVEESPIGLQMLDTRPSTSFDLIYWDDSNLATGANPTIELDGTNLDTHIWTDGNNDLVNTWSFGYFEVNSQNVTFTYTCDEDGDGVSNGTDLDSDNDGLSNASEGNHLNDTDGDNIPDYVDTDFAGFADSNGDGINDNFDSDLDGVPNALDVDSDNDGIPDMIENGLMDADNDGTLNEGSVLTDVNGNGLFDTYDPACDGSSTLTAGDATAVFGENSVNNSARAVGAPDNSRAAMNNTADFLIMNMGIAVASGEDIVIESRNTTSAHTMDVEQSTDGAIFTNTQNFSFAVIGTQEAHTYTLVGNARYIRITMGTDAGGGAVQIDALSYSYSAFICNTAVVGVAVTATDSDTDTFDDYLDLDSDNDGIVDVTEAGGTAGSDGRIASFTDSDGNGRNDAQEVTPLSIPDTDADGTLPNYIDIDSDNDGISDNVEGQSSTIYIAIAAGDTDSNGLLDVYDPNNGGTLITPVNTDGSGNEDYFDTDADGDGVLDFIEGHDANSNGFGDWDTDSDNDISDEIGYNVDTNADGLWDIYDSNNGGTTAPTQNTDGSGFSDWQDTDDDDDGNLTSGEDINTNGDWTDDLDQGGLTIPNYLYRGDFDGDAIADALDADSDNDGITDATESNGEVINPSADADSDGVANYRDPDISGSLADATDSNSDGVYDVYDSDFDGIPDFLDLDSDNDGILDAIEANNGSVPFGLDTSSGQFQLQDPDNDGLMNYVDTDDVTATTPTSDLANADTDSDGVKDYLDIDSDRDGIVDNIESQTTSSYIASTLDDTDGDGIKDVYDPNNGGSLITPVNTDGLDLQDYIDTDSDNDGVLDIIEGDDTNSDGFGDWDATGSNNDITDETGYGTDTDGDGLDDIFDTVILGTFGNETGSNTDLQNSDGTDELNWRDTNDDNDSALTSAEDDNSNGNWTDDLTQGQPGGVVIPDYLFNADNDEDGLVDASDLDSDNDGILDSEEANGESIDPSGDVDGDGIPNYRDADDTGVTNNIVEVDSNSDGVWDNYDSDLDGVPDFQDLDSDNDGVPDIIESGGIDADGNGVVDNITDTDGDGLADTFDTNNGGTLLSITDVDGDGFRDSRDIDADNDGLPDIIEAGGTDSDGNGKVDNTTDTDSDGLVDLVDTDNGGTVYTIPDTDSDGNEDYQDVDSDNDGIPDTIENGGSDSDYNGKIDTFSTDTDGDGWADVVDSDNGGMALGTLDADADGIANFRDLDSDNDGYQDILEASGTDADNDGVVDAMLDSDEDGIPDTADVDIIGGGDTDADGISNTADVDETGGNDTDGDGVDNNFDPDDDGNGFDDATELTPFEVLDSDADGNNNFYDIDSDDDGIPDVTEFGGLTTNSSNAQISGFTDADLNGWNDAQDGNQGGTVVTPVNTDSSTDPTSIPDFLDLDSDDDGIVDNYEAQTKATYIAHSTTVVDTDNDGLDDVYDPDNGGSIITPVNTDAAGNADYLDADSDADTVIDNVEGANSDKNQYADWDANTNATFDDSGYNADLDSDGILDIFDNFSGSGKNQITGSGSAVQDTDNDSVWDFQDTDDDNDGLLTSSQGGGGEDSGSNGDPTDDFDDDVNNIIPNFLYGSDDSDGDGITDDTDVDSDNDGLADAAEDGGTGIDPSGDIDGDGLFNYQDPDMDGDALLNTIDTDGDGSGTNTTGFTDTNSDGVIDQFDKDLDGAPDYKDLDSDNDGISDLIEFGLTDTDEDGTLDEGSGITDFNANGMEDAYDAACLTPVFNSGNATAVESENSVNTSANALGAPDDNRSSLNATGDFLVLNMGLSIPTGEDIIVQVRVTQNFHEMELEQSTDGSSFTNVTSFTFSSTATDEDKTYTLSGAAQYIRITMSVDAGAGAVAVDAASYSFTSYNNTCSGANGIAISVLDTDSDGIDNYLDLDSDNDGITDNRESQLTSSYVPPASGDADGDGLLDVYDGSGNAIVPVNTDGLGSADYLDTDSDDDGVLDNIEGWDADSNGFADWDTDSDNDITDESGYNTDTDNDGIWFIFDNNQGLGQLANIDGSDQDLKDSDADATLDFRDVDDDADGTNTSAEDTGDGMGGGADGDWSNDFGQGGATTPDYLYNPDVDGDGIVDQTDLDSDNDGVLNTDEYTGAVYGSSGTPFDDADSDGIYNYLDISDVNNPSFVDSNSDGVDDQVDQDFDGIPNFFDLDSDNDGILDGIEANDGAVPTGFSTTTGIFAIGADSDSDGLNDNVDVSTGGTALAKSNLDGDSLDDYLDLDSDNDGITDNVEGQTTLAFASPSGNDTDNDGLDDTYDANNGGSTVTPVNTDGTDEPDYRDTNSDNDLSNSLFIGDNIEGFDANKNGFSDLDVDLDGLLSDEAGYNTDTDGDGLWNLFDSFSGSGVSNINGSNANLQDTDGDGVLDFRDTDDDDDNITTTVEDVDADGIWTNDKVQGGGATPDYLYFNDSDGDLVADGLDVDGDNDGIPNNQEYNFGTDPGPFNDADGDGIFNYNDPDNPGALTDSNADGIWDEYDLDLDGVPNVFDLDSDNDGIPDIIEAGGTDADGDGQLDGITDTDGDGLLDTYDVDQTGGADSDADGIDDLYDISVLGSGTDLDGDDVRDDVDRDDDGDGVIDTIDTDEGGVILTIPDTDSDTIVDMWDLDTDNDGILDLIEGGGADSNGDGQLDGFGDTDGDGWGNSVDSDNGGTALTIPNTDGTGDPNYMDQDSDGDGKLDYDEGFDDDEDGDSSSDNEDYEVRATAYGNASHYNPNNLSWLTDFRTFGSGNYLDSDGDGIINLYDTDAGGNFYGNVSGAPNNDSSTGDTLENYLDGNDVGLPLDFLKFTGYYEEGNVYLEWITANEFNVSHFNIEYSVDGLSFSTFGKLEAVNIESLISNYHYSHSDPVDGFNYYRITQHDFDGKYESSKTISIFTDNNRLVFDLYPNPTLNYLNIKTTVNVPVIFLNVVDIRGSIVHKETLRSEGLNVEHVLDISDFYPGIYYMLFQVEGIRYEYKIIKQ